MTHIFKAPAALAITAILTVAGFTTTAAAADYASYVPAPAAAAQNMFDQSRIDPALSAAQFVGNPYTVAGKTYTPAHTPSYDMVGSVSWYGDKFQGKMTASGETFNKNAMTAAHKTLPLNSLVVVTNMATGQVLTVRINDRGPFIGNGVIDLSEAAAVALGYAATGPAPVRVQYAGPAVQAQKVQTRPVQAPRSQAYSIAPRVSLPAAPIAAPKAYAQNDYNGDQTEVLTIKGPVHMASQTNKGTQARFIRAVHRTTYLTK